MRSSFLLEPPPSPLPAGRAFLRQARFRLHDDYMVKITRAIAEVTDEQIWWRPNRDSNSIGNLILHLCGNARQWIVSGIGGATDTRERAREFEIDQAVDRRALVNQLEDTVRDVDAQLSELDRQLVADPSEAPLHRQCRPQGFDQTVLDAVFHVVEHFSYHTGQIVLLAKWHAGDRVRLYDERRLNTAAASGPSTLNED